MCWACEGGGEQVGIGPALAAHARRIEAVMPGPAIPDEAWAIFLGHAEGSVLYAQTRRMMECVEAATTKIGARLRCDAA